MKVTRTKGTHTMGSENERCTARPGRGAAPRRSPRELETGESGPLKEKSRRDGRDGRDVREDAVADQSKGRSRSRGGSGSNAGVKKEDNDDDAAANDDTKGQELPQKKGRSRKGKPSVASGGAVQEPSSGKKRGRSLSKGGAKKPAPKIPKLPMVKEGEHWYRTRVLKETEKRIHVEFAGYEQTMPATWLPKFSERVWLGSYKGKDWRYQGDGAWVPKNGINNKIITIIVK